MHKMRLEHENQWKAEQAMGLAEKTRREELEGLLNQAEQQRQDLEQRMMRELQKKTRLLKYMYTFATFASVPACVFILQKFRS